MYTIVRGKITKVNYEILMYPLIFHPRGYTHIISANTEIIDTPIYFESENLDYRLGVGEHFEGYLIEKIEGTEDGDMIYYTNKIIEIIDNLEEKAKLNEKVKKLNYYEEEPRYSDGKETLKINKKWYQFWK